MLSLARTDHEPITTTHTTNEPDRLAGHDANLNSLMGRYYSHVRQLCGACFHDGICHDQTERRIRETSVYICDAEQLA